jgi:hypothetical protein
VCQRRGVRRNRLSRATCQVHAPAPQRNGERYSALPIERTEKHHEETCSCNRGRADDHSARARPGWFRRQLRQHRLKRCHRRARHVSRHTRKLGSERHGSDAGANSGSVVHIPIELRHAGYRLKRHPHSDRHRADACSHARSIHHARIAEYNGLGATSRLRHIVNPGRRDDRRGHATDYR